jgi:hypothetical protein
MASRPRECAMLSRPLGGLAQSDDPDRPRKQRHRNVTRVPLPKCYQAGLTP